MAKSIFTTLEEGSFEVVHIGNEVILDLPQWMEGLNEVFESEEGMLEWAQDNEIVLPMLQTAVQAVLISLRAVARPTVKGYNSLHDYEIESAAHRSIEGENYTYNDKTLTISRNIIDDIVGCQDRVNDFVWKTVKKPGQVKVISEDQALEALAKSGKSDAELMAMLMAKIEAKKGASVQ